MAKNNPKYLVFIWALAFSACFEKEQPIEPYPRGDNMEAEVELGSDYRYQAYFNLSKGEWLNKQLKNNWDIAWSCSDTSNSIEINSGHGMWAAHTTESDLSKITDTTGLQFKFDWSGGHPDSLALSKWDQIGGAWVFDMGYDVNGLHTGFIKAKFKLINPNTLYMEYAALEGGESKEAQLEKDNTFLSVFFSFRNHTQVEIEPPKNEWDLVFRQYHHYFPEPDDLTYQVTGVFTNPGIEVAKDTGDYERFQAEDIALLTFSNRRDQIGYDWKDFTINTGAYTVASRQLYLIRDREGFLYKMHFVDFYNATGESGTPAFVYRKL